jgi:hypothetical protein
MVCGRTSELPNSAHCLRFNIDPPVDVLLVRGMRVHVARRNLLRLTSISASIIGFGLLLPRVGVWPALLLLLVSCLMIMGEKRWHVFILAPLLTSLGGWFLIEILLGVYVEPGACWS